jgi:SAM-dependent methyltransferase
VRSPLTCYSAALRRTAAGRPVRLRLVAAGARRSARWVEPARWVGDLCAGDHGVLDRCVGPSLDVGCGPGRLAAALTGRGVPAVGIDISTEAVRLARRRGATAHRMDVFSGAAERLSVPSRRAGWRHALLIDGNIGIGGNPPRLLRRCARLLRAGGDILVELDPPGSGTWRGPVVLVGDGRASWPFPWAAVAVDDLERLARRAALPVRETWTEAGRWFARIGSG